MIGLRHCGSMVTFILGVALLLLSHYSVCSAQTEINISCTDLNDPVGTCTVSPPVSSLTNLVQTINDIKDCQVDPTTNTAVCTAVNGESFSCTKTTGDKAICQFPDTTTINCDITGTGASCTIAPPDQKQVDDALQALSTSPPQQEMARVIGSICEKRNVSADLQRDCDLLIGNALSGDTTQAKNALAQITPDGAGAPIDASHTSVNAQSRNVSLRLTELRSGAPGISLSGLILEKDGWNISLADHPKNNYLYDDPRGGGASADSAVNFGRLGVFINGTISVGDKSNTMNENGFDLNGMDITAGVDYHYTDQLFAGMAFGYSASATKLNSGRGKLDMNGYNIILYSTYYATQAVYIDASYSYGGNDYGQKRNIRYTLLDPITLNNVDVDQTASADYFGTQQALNLSAGYELATGSFTYGPYSRFQWVTSKVKGYNEQMSSINAPGSGWALNIDSQSYQSLLLSLGGKVSYAISRSWGVLVPQMSLELMHEFKNDLRVVSGQFVGDPNNEKFRLPTNKPDVNYGNLSIGMSAVSPGGQTAYINYDKLIGFKDLSYYAVSAGIRWEF